MGHAMICNPIHVPTLESEFDAKSSPFFLQVRVGLSTETPPSSLLPHGNTTTLEQLLRMLTVSVTGSLPVWCQSEQEGHQVQTLISVYTNSYMTSYYSHSSPTICILAGLLMVVVGIQGNGMELTLQAAESLPSLALHW